MSSKKDIIKTAENFATLSSIGVFWTNPHGEILKLNNPLIELLGFKSLKTASDYYKKSLINIFQEKEYFVQILEETARNNISSLRKFNLVKGDKALIPVSINFEKLLNEKDPLIVGYVNRIPEEESNSVIKSSLSKQMFNLVNGLKDFYYIRNGQGIIEKANIAFIELMGATGMEQLNTIDFAEKNHRYGSFYKKDEEFLKKLQNKEYIPSRHFTDTELLENFLVRRIPLSIFNEGANSLLVFGFDFTDLVLTEKAIVNNHMNLRSIIENAQSSVTLINKDRRVIVCNAAFKQFIYQFFDNEITETQSLLNILPESLQNIWHELIDKSFEGATIAREQTLLKEKREYSFEIVITPISDTNANINTVSIFISDITERKEAELALKESENRFRQLAENTSDAFILSDEDGIIYVNPAFERLTGHGFKHNTGQSDLIELMINEIDRPHYIKNKSLLLTKGILYKGHQYRFNTTTGQSKQVWVRGYPIVDNKGQVYRYLMVLSDLTELSELKNAVSTSQLQQKAILDNIPFLAWLKDKEGKYISVNDPFAKFFHKSEMEIIGHTDRELFSEETADRNESYYYYALNAQKRQLREEIWETEKGLQWIETITTPIFSDNGDLIGVTGISRDISDRKKREENIIENEEHFRSMLQYSSDAISIIDSQGLIIFESSLRNRISDFMIDELIGKPFSEKIHPDDINLFEVVLNQILKEPNIQIKREYRSLHKNKKWIYVESIFSNHINNPSIKGIVVNTRDVSDRKMSELKEKVYHENLIFLSNSAIDLLGISDREDIFRYIAEKLHSFLEDAIVVVASFSEQTDTFKINQVAGIDQNNNSINDLLGISLLGLEYSRDNSFFSFENAGSVTIFSNPTEEIRLDNFPDGSVKKIIETLNINKVYNISMARNNKLLGNITILTLNRTIIKFKHIIEAFVHQVSVALHRCQLEFELMQAKTKAEESDMLKTAFLANMSHEIRTPMNGILGFAEMLNDESITESNRKKYVEIINSNGKMLMNLIDDIIDFAKIEAGQIKILKQEFSLNTLLTQIHSSFLAESLKKEKTNVKLRIRKAFSNEDCYIQTDPNRLRQILTNLVGNAFKFTQEGYIEFGYNLPEQGFLEFYVRDTGIGIPEDKINLVFERFVQADYSRSRKYSGSGLGLAISKGFVELLGGQMWASSEVNKGSTFSFTIPYIPAVKKAQEEIEKKKSNAEYNWSGKCFLVAEDDKFSFKLLEGFLKKTKADILHAEDGQQAVDICKSNDSIDLILMDVQMPEMNGMEATRYIKRFRKKLPIIAQTANAIAEERQRCFEAGFDDFVTKPINISELFAKIEKCLAAK